MATQDVRKRGKQAKNDASSDKASSQSVPNKGGDSAGSAAEKKRSLVDVWWPTLCVAAAAAIFMIIVPQLPHPKAASTKPYTTFNDFFPFYLTEHADLVNRRLHVIGTTIVLLITAFFPSMAVNAVAAAALGVAVQPLMLGFETGAIEGIVCGATLLLLNRHTTGSLRSSLMIALAGYGFAWVGHFAFEQNKPASWIYPIYSFMGDFNMWALAVTRSIPV